MRHTVYRNVLLRGDILSLRTSGTEGTVDLRLSSVRKVKFPFPRLTVETENRTYRLDLSNVEPSEYAEMKAILTHAAKGKYRTANNTPEGIRQPATGLPKPSA